MKGKFITVEGVEGVGKSTNIDFIRNHLENHNHKVCVTREPGGTPLAEEIRAVLLDQRDEAMPQNAELLLMFAARAVHIRNLIQPALDCGEWVLCDRFTDATYAYQGAGRGLATRDIDALKEVVQGTLEPDLTLYLDAPLETSLERAQTRNDRSGNVDRFETEEPAFFERVRAAYLELAASNPDRIVTIDANQSLSQVQEEIRKAVNKILK